LKLSLPLKRDHLVSEDANDFVFGWSELWMDITLQTVRRKINGRNKSRPIISVDLYSYSQQHMHRKRQIFYAWYTRSNRLI